MTVRRRVVVHGRVQGVFFRDSCRTEARRSRVAGWVTNRTDGTVEAVFEGAQAAVDTLLAWVHHGPRQASVERVDVTAEAPTGETGFDVR